MTNEQLIEKFNPANGANITPEDLETLHSLTDEQIDVLAKAFPNTPTRRAYLRLYDKNMTLEKQLYQLSTWQNLRNNRKFSSKKNLIAWDFFTTGTRVNATAHASAKNVKASATSPRKVVVDLTATEAAAELQKSVKAAPAKKTTTAPITAAKPAKAKTTAAKTTAPAPTKVTAPAAETGATPADQQFGDGTGQ
jgi:hypothetical protein